MRKVLGLFIVIAVCLSGLQTVSANVVVSVNDIFVEYVEGDSTVSIKAAISEAEKTQGKDRIILKNPGEGKVWVSEPIYLKNNIELYFEEGAILEAKSGSITNLMESFINIVETKNVSIIGENSESCIIRMPIDEYTQGEHRHSVLISGSENVILKGVTLLKSGGDGICVTDLNMTANVQNSTPQNILIEDITVDGAARNGISFIAGNDIVVNNCVFKNTGEYNPAGLAAYGPWAGIDWEPESRSYLNNTKVYNSQFLSNRMSGLLFSIIKPNQIKDTFKADVKNCTIRDNLVSINVLGNEALPNAFVTIENCLFENSSYNMGFVEWKTVGKALIKDTVFNNTDIDKTALFSVDAHESLQSEAAEFDVGNIEFDNVRVYNSRAEKMVKLSGGNSQYKIRNVSGTIYSDRENMTLEFDENFCEDINVKIEKATDTATQAIEKLNERGKAYVEEGALLAAEKELLMQNENILIYASVTENDVIKRVYPASVKEKDGLDYYYFPSLGNSGTYTVNILATENTTVSINNKSAEKFLATQSYTVNDKPKVFEAAVNAENIEEKKLLIIINRGGEAEYNIQNGDIFKPESGLSDSSLVSFDGTATKCTASINGGARWEIPENAVTPGYYKLQFYNCYNTGLTTNAQFIARANINGKSVDQNLYVNLQSAADSAGGASGWVTVGEVYLAGDGKDKIFVFKRDDTGSYLRLAGIHLSNPDLMIEDYGIFHGDEKLAFPAAGDNRGVLKAYNFKEQNADARLILAKYDETGKLLKQVVYNKDNKNSARLNKGNINLETSAITVGADEKCVLRLFCWEDGTIKPFLDECTLQKTE